MLRRTGNQDRFPIRSFLGMVLAAFLLTPGLLLAQTLTATVSRNPVGVNEQFELKFTLEGAGGRFKAPSLAEFHVLSGPNQSQNFSMINGAMSQSISFSYILQPKKEGTFKIEPAKVETSGKELSSNPISLSVVKGQGGQQGGQQGQGEKTNISTNNIFIRVTVDKSSVYRGEAVVATFKLYSNVTLINYAISKAPSFNGFWNHDLEMPPQLQLRNETLNGVNYQVGEIKKIVLYPQQSGTLTIDPMEGEVIARVQVKRTRSNNPFDVFNDPFFNDPFFGAGGYRDVRYLVKSDPVKINVKELPANAPASFKGAVGSFSMDASVDKPSLKANDAATLKVKISGKGNMKLIEAPEFNISADIESYDPKTEDNISFSGKGASGSRVFEYLLIPRVPGKYELGEAEFTYFDPSKKQYITLRKGPFTLNVARGEGGGVAVTGTGKADFRVLGRDIRYIKTGPVEFVTKNDSLFGSWLFWVLTLLPLGALGGLTWYYRKHREELANVALFKSRKAGSMAVKRLSLAKKFLDGGDTSGFYTETYKALWDYSAHKLGIPVSELTREQVAGKLQSIGTEPELIKAFEQVIDTCEMSRFAAGALGKTPAEVYSEAVDVITRIENGTGK